jgi:hypothetical protein
MVMMQRITIMPDGSAMGLRSKGGVDLRSMGEVSTVRTTDIKFDEDSQKWFFEFLNGKLGGCVYCGTMSLNELGEEPKMDLICDRSGIYLFQEYEEAVVEEIRVVNKLRSLYGKDIV